MILVDQTLKKEYRIEENTNLGRRSSNAIQIPDKDISSSHCKFISKENGYYIMDTSLNGTYFLIESQRGLYVKNKMEIEINSYRFLIKKKENIIKFIPISEEFGQIVELEVKINKIIDLEIGENGLQRVKRRNNENNEKIIAVLSLEENKDNESDMVLMKPQNTKFLLFFWVFFYSLILQIMAKIAKRQRIPLSPKYTVSFGIEI